MKVLVIDDDPNIAEVISVSLEIRWPQIMVLTAVDGDEGLSLVESESPDVVILDIGLPGINGVKPDEDFGQSSSYATRVQAVLPSYPLAKPACAS